MDGKLFQIYCDEMPGCLRAMLDAPALLRLRDVGMNCGCEYTDFPRFRDLQPYSRYEHSVGVALLIWRFTHDPRQAVAGLLHDIATPCFAHVVDFLNGDHLAQESTEVGTEAAIRDSAGIQAALRALGLSTADVCDYHIWPIADNDTPRLSADRLEYTLGNAVNFGIAGHTDVRRMVGDLRVGAAEDGAPEIVFSTPAVARLFCDCALACSAIYVSDADRSAMQHLAELLGDALRAGVIERSDLMGTEPAIIEKLCSDAACAAAWRGFRALNAVERGVPGAPEADGWRVIPAKKRWINPLVNGVRAADLFPDFAARAAAFVGERQSAPLRAFVQNA